MILSNGFSLRSLRYSSHTCAVGARLYRLNGLLGNHRPKQQAAAHNGNLSSLISRLKLILLEIKTQVSLGGGSRTGKETINFGVSGPLLTPEKRWV